MSVPPPGSYSMEDAGTYKWDTVYPYQTLHSKAFLWSHGHISRNYFQSPEEVPTFIGDDGRGGCLSFLLPPKLVLTEEGVRPLRDGEGACWKVPFRGQMETRAGATGGATVGPQARRKKLWFSKDADCGRRDSGLKRKRATGDDGAGPSKRVRHVSLGLSTSTEEETPDASPTLAAKEVTETPPPNVEATSDSSAPVTHAAQSPPQTGPKAFEGMPVDQLMEEFDMVTAQQAALVAQLRARFSNERSQSIQKDEEILLLKTQLADAQAEAESSRSYAQNLAEEKMALLVKVEQERADCLPEYKASCHWAVKYLEGGVHGQSGKGGKGWDFGSWWRYFMNRGCCQCIPTGYPGILIKQMRSLVAALVGLVNLFELPSFCTARSSDLAFLCGGWAGGFRVGWPERWEGWE
ncbi:hypothetical protein Tco_0528668 [Tanacetum coccineum]